MKPTNFILRNFYLLFILTIPWVSCDDKDQFDFNQHNKVAVTTLQVIGVTKNDATLNGRVNTKNGEALTEIGICYSTQPKPTISSEKVIMTGDLDTGAFTLHIQSLKPSTTYYYRAFATNASGTAYGDPLSFTTQSGYVSKLETEAATAITRVSAQLGGKIIDDGGYPVTSKGICYSYTTSYPTISNDKLTVDTQSTSYKANLTKLRAGTTYYARAYATSSAGTGYGQIISFTTASPIVASGITTVAASLVTYSSATVGGSVLEDNGASITLRGLCYSATNSVPSITNGSVVNIGSGTGPFSGQLIGLAVNTTYYVRAFATNSAGTAYGPVVNFKTLLPDLPSVSTMSPTSITMISAYTGGYIRSTGGGKISSKGVVYSSSNAAPTLNSGTAISGGSGTDNFYMTLSGLKYNTTYYVRSYATNEAGTSYGNTYTFKTLLPSLPSNLNTYSASSIQQNSVYVSGYVGTAGGGTITSRGIVYSNTNSLPTVGNSNSVSSGTGTGSLNVMLTGLAAGRTYYARVYATNEAGTAYGNIIYFTTSSPYTAPTGVVTSSVNGIGSSYATFNGYVATDGGSQITERGFVYSTYYSVPTLSTGTKTTVSGNATGYFSKSVIGLTRYITYYVRAYATNAYGTTYGAATAFSPY